MNKKLIAAIVLLISGKIMAQVPEDALRYSRIQATGTARTQALGGASGSIGGEISTLFSNPANLGFYRTGDLVITGGYNGNSTDATYFGEKTSANKGAGMLGVSGIVLGSENRGGRTLKSSAFGIAISRTADFNNLIKYGGLNTKSSMADMFLEQVVADQGNLQKYSTSLVSNVNWIVKDNNGSYFSPASDIAHNGGVIQEGTLKTNGGITEITFGGGANLNNKVYLGGSIGLPVLRYGATRLFTETDPTTNPDNYFDGATFDDDLVTKGMGINVKIGAVFAPSPNFRIGVAAHSPTWYSLTDDYYAEAYANSEGLPQNEGKNEAWSHPNESSVFDYNLQTPYKLMGSLTYLIGNVEDVKTQKGLITGDIEYVNYMASSFRVTGENDSYDDRQYFKDLNNAIDNAYKGTVNARLGAELKFNTIMARFGGAYYGNPYKNLASEKGDLYQGTLGVGYRNKGFFVDLGYIHSFSKDVFFPYRLENKNSFEPASLKGNGSRVLLTLGFKI